MIEEMRKMITESIYLTEKIKYPVTALDDIGPIKVLQDGTKIFENCKNGGVISESSLTRLMRQVQKNNSEFAIITAYRYSKSRKQNIERNRVLRGKLNDLKMGVHPLIGVWQECQNDISVEDCPKEEIMCKKNVSNIMFCPESDKFCNPQIEYKKCPEKYLKPSTERTYFVVKPKDMSSDYFKNKMIELMTIGGEVQDTIVYSNGKKVGLMDSLGRFNAFEKQDFNINKIAQAYSRHLNKQNTPFVFEGMEIPGSNAGSQIRTRENILYII